MSDGADAHSFRAAPCGSGVAGLAADSVVRVIIQKQAMVARIWAVGRVKSRRRDKSISKSGIEVEPPKVRALVGSQSTSGAVEETEAFPHDDKSSMSTASWLRVIASARNAWNNSAHGISNIFCSSES